MDAPCRSPNKAALKVSKSMLSGIDSNIIPMFGITFPPTLSVIEARLEEYKIRENKILIQQRKIVLKIKTN